MKVKQIEKDIKFKPITLEITIESQKELDDLYHRLCINCSQGFDEHITEHHSPNRKIWETIRDINITRE